MAPIFCGPVFSVGFEGEGGVCQRGAFGTKVSPQCKESFVFTKLPLNPWRWGAGMAPICLAKLERAVALPV